MKNAMLHTPDGVRDIYNGECKAKLFLQDRLHKVLLKYGYHDDIYFSPDDISNILNIDQEKVANYYNMSLSLLKKGTDAFINQYIKQEASKIKKVYCTN